jgi:hypothetical protein
MGPHLNYNCNIPSSRNARSPRQYGLLHKAILGSVLAISCSWSVQVLADAHTSADANLFGCVNLNTKPATPVTYKFGTKALQCMASIGKDVSLIATQAGVSCVAIGYVQQKGWTDGGDNCYGLNSGLMLLSYNQVNGAASGSVQTDWWTYLLYNNHMRLESASSTYINVCSSPALCKDTAVSWPWAGEPVKNLYIIFQPQAASTNSAKSEESTDLNPGPIDRQR